MAAARLLTLITIGLAYTGLIGCAGVESKGSDAYAPIEPIVYPTVEESPPTGGLFSPKRKLTLFADVRAGKRVTERRAELGELLLAWCQQHDS